MMLITNNELDEIWIFFGNNVAINNAVSKLWNNSNKVDLVTV